MSVITITTANGTVFAKPFITIKGSNAQEVADNVLSSMLGLSEPTGDVE